MDNSLPFSSFCVCSIVRILQSSHLLYEWTDQLTYYHKVYIIYNMYTRLWNGTCGWAGNVFYIYLSFACGHFSLKQSSLSCDMITMFAWWGAYKDRDCWGTEWQCTRIERSPYCTCIKWCNVHHGNWSCHLKTYIGYDWVAVGIKSSNMAAKLAWVGFSSLVSCSDSTNSSNALEPLVGTSWRMNMIFSLVVAIVPSLSLWSKVSIFLASSDGLRSSGFIILQSSTVHFCRAAFSYLFIPVLTKNCVWGGIRHWSLCHHKLLYHWHTYAYVTICTFCSIFCEQDFVGQNFI